MHSTCARRLVWITAVLIAVSPFAVATELSLARNWRGHVSDRKCGKNVDADCNKRCIAAGEPPVLVVDGTGDVYSVSNPDALKAYPGEHVEVTGTLVGTALTVETAKPLREDQSGRKGATPSYGDLYGDYRIAKGHVVGISRFRTDAGDDALLFSDYESGVVRRLFPASIGEFTMGPGFALSSPIELKIEFQRDQRGVVTGLRLAAAAKPEVYAARIPISQEEVSFASGDAKLAGTLLLPVTPGAHPAIILLHGSGPLTRDSFGPYPFFFASLGFAVLTYDKRGTGASTGTFMDRASFYPDDITNDALAAFDFLRRRSGVNPEKIGLWGSSEGGMLTTQVAARSDKVAFIINSSGFMMPLWQQLLYTAKAQLRADGFSARDADDAEAFQRLRLRVARTGEGQEELQSVAGASQGKKWFGILFAGSTTSLDELRWQWTHVYQFDPVPALKKIKCPVLGLFGGLDVFTPASTTVATMQRALAEGGNKDVTLKVFPNANHSLALAHSGSDGEIPELTGQVPGLFPMLSSWLLRQAQARGPRNSPDRLTAAHPNTVGL